MNREEAIKLLALIKVAYPTAYKDMDTASKQATVNMWHTTFPQVPYPIMEMAFNRFRMVSKFPPTVADMCEELKSLYWKSTGDALAAASIGDTDNLKLCEFIMEHTNQYRSNEYINSPVYSGMKALAGRVGIGQLTEGNRYD